MKFIEDLRQRPEEERMVFSAVTAGSVALILFLLWGMTFFSGNTIVTKNNNQSASAVKGIEDLSKNTKDSFTEITAQYDEFKKVMQQDKVGVSISVDKNGEIQTKNIIIGPQNVDKK